MVLNNEKLIAIAFNFALEYAVRRVQVNHDGLKLNCTQSFGFMSMMLICWEVAYILCRKTQKF